MLTQLNRFGDCVQHWNINIKNGKFIFFWRDPQVGLTLSDPRRSGSHGVADWSRGWVQWLPRGLWSSGWDRITSQKERKLRVRVSVGLELILTSYWRIWFRRPIAMPYADIDDNRGIVSVPESQPKRRRDCLYSCFEAVGNDLWIQPVFGWRAERSFGEWIKFGRRVAQVAVCKEYNFSKGIWDCPSDGNGRNK